MPDCYSQRKADLIFFIQTAHACVTRSNKACTVNLRSLLQMRRQANLFAMSARLVKFRQLYKMNMMGEFEKAWIFENK